MDNASRKMFIDICGELGIKCTLLSKDWVFMLEKDGITRFFVGSKSPLNNYTVGEIIDDKYALYCILKEKGLPVVEYNIVYCENNHNDFAIDCNSIEYVKDYFYNNNQDIVLKPCRGTCGRDVYRIKDIQKLEQTYNMLTSKYYSISMSPFYHIKNEYRFIVLDNEIRISYKKDNPVVYGDGKHTIRELLFRFNRDYFFDILDDSFYDRILDVDEKYEYNWKHNLALGSISSEIKDKNLYDKLASIAISAAKEIGLRFGSIDIVVTEDDEYLIMEINSGVMLYNKTRPLYKEVILKMFNS